MRYWQTLSAGQIKLVVVVAYVTRLVCHLSIQAIASRTPYLSSNCLCACNWVVHNSCLHMCRHVLSVQFEMCMTLPIVGINWPTHWCQWHCPQHFAAVLVCQQPAVFRDQAQPGAVACAVCLQHYALTVDLVITVVCCRHLTRSVRHHCSADKEQI